MENIEILACIFCALVFVPSVYFIFHQRKTRLKIKEILWKCYLPVEDCKIEEFSIIDCLDYDRIIKIKEDFFKKKEDLHSLTLDHGIAPFGEFALISDIEEADKQVSALNVRSRKVFIMCSTTSTIAHLLMSICYLLHSNM